MTKINFQCRDHYHPNAGMIMRVLEGICQFVDHFRMERIFFRGAVQGDGEHMVIFGYGQKSEALLGEGFQNIEVK